jgi:hypothetical protein
LFFQFRANSTEATTPKERAEMEKPPNAELSSPVPVVSIIGPLLMEIFPSAKNETEDGHVCKKI